MNPAQGDNPSVQTPVSTEHIAQPSAPTTTPVPQAAPVPLVVSTIPSINMQGKRKFSHKLLFLIPILLLVGTMVIVSALLPSLKKTATQEAQVTPEPTLIPATPIPTTKPDPRQGWKEYLNREAQLSFRYPPQLSLHELKTSATLFTITLSDDTNASASATIVKILSGKSTTAAELMKNNGEADLAIKSSESDIDVSGLVGKKVVSTLVSDPTKQLIYTTAEQETSAYAFLLYDTNASATYDLILGSIRIVSSGITPDWQTYTNSLGGYSLRFPPSWSLNVSSATNATESAKAISIRKNPSEAQFQNLVIQTTVTSKKERIDLNASEIVTSIQNLSGWKITPTLDFRTIGGGQAEILSGEKDGAWHVYAVLWFKSTLIEISWRDTLLRREQETFNDMIGSFQFK